MDEGCTYTDRIGPDADGETVARFYAARYRHSSEADWRARAEAGLILRNGLPAGPDDRLRAGDVLRWNRPPWREPDVPRDVRVVAWANAGMGPSYFRELTRMEMDPVRAGAAVAEAALEFLDKGAWPANSVIGPSWKLGETLGAHGR